MDPDAIVLSVPVFARLDEYVGAWAMEESAFRAQWDAIARMDLLAHMKTLTHKAEVAERRHVDAARGKEKLALARQRAADSIEAMCKQRKLPRFTRTMLTQAWTDVMALTALRRGEESDAWQQQIAIAQRLVDLADATERPNDAEALLGDIQAGLTQVGYQTEEAAAIARRLVDPSAVELDEGSSRTELTMRLKSGARLGEELENATSRTIPLTTEQMAHLDALKQVPFGTWFDFVTNQQGDIVRRRLSWFSVATGHALFVNHRGQKVAEHTLEQLARLMAKNQLSIVENEKGSLLDRAWSNVIAALQSFTPDSRPGGTRCSSPGSHWRAGCGWWSLNRRRAPIGTRRCLRSSALAASGTTTIREKASSPFTNAASYHSTAHARPRVERRPMLRAPHPQVVQIQKRGLYKVPPSPYTKQFLIHYEYIFLASMTHSEFHGILTALSLQRGGYDSPQERIDNEILARVY